MFFRRLFGASQPSAETGNTGDSNVRPLNLNVDKQEATPPRKTTARDRLDVQPEYNIKLVVVGGSGTGKSSIVRRYAQGIFTSRYLPTLGTDVLSVPIQFSSRTGVTSHPTIGSPAPGDIVDDSSDLLSPRQPQPPTGSSDSPAAAAAAVGHSQHTRKRTSGKKTQFEIPLRVQLWDVPHQELKTGRNIHRVLEDAHGVVVVFDVTNVKSVQAVDQWREVLPRSFQNILLCAHKSDKPRHITSASALDSYIRDCGFIGWHLTTARSDGSVREAIDFLLDRILLQMLQKHKGLPLEKARLYAVKPASKDRDRDKDRDRESSFGPPANSRDALIRSVGISSSSNSGSNINYSGSRPIAAGGDRSQQQQQHHSGSMLRYSGSASPNSRVTLLVNSSNAGNNNTTAAAAGDANDNKAGGWFDGATLSDTSESQSQIAFDVATEAYNLQVIDEDIELRPIQCTTAALTTASGTGGISSVASPKPSAGGLAPKINRITGMDISGSVSDSADEEAQAALKFQSEVRQFYRQLAERFIEYERLVVSTSAPQRQPLSDEHDSEAVLDGGMPIHSRTGGQPVLTNESDLARCHLAHVLLEETRKESAQLLERISRVVELYNSVSQSLSAALSPTNNAAALGRPMSPKAGTGFGFGIDGSGLSAVVTVIANARKMFVNVKRDFYTVYYSKWTRLWYNLRSEKLLASLLSPQQPLLLDASVTESDSAPLLSSDTPVKQQRQQSFNSDSAPGTPTTPTTVLLGARHVFNSLETTSEVIRTCKIGTPESHLSSHLPHGANVAKPVRVDVDSGLSRSVNRGPLYSTEEMMSLLSSGGGSPAASDSGVVTDLSNAGVKDQYEFNFKHISDSLALQLSMFTATAEYYETKLPQYDWSIDNLQTGHSLFAFKNIGAKIAMFDEMDNSDDNTTTTTTTAA